MILALLATTAQAESVTLSWDPVDRATGYRLYLSTDGGTSWDARDVGHVTEYEWPDVPEDSIVLWKAGAYNEAGDAVMEWAGAWVDITKKPPAVPHGLGVR